MVTPKIIITDGQIEDEANQYAKRHCEISDAYYNNEDIVSQAYKDGMLAMKAMALEFICQDFWIPVTPGTIPKSSNYNGTSNNGKSPLVLIADDSDIDVGCFDYDNNKWEADIVTNPTHYAEIFLPSCSNLMNKAREIKFTRDDYLRATLIIRGYGEQLQKELEEIQKWKAVNLPGKPTFATPQTRIEDADIPRRLCNTIISFLSDIEDPKIGDLEGRSRKAYARQRDAGILSQKQLNELCVAAGVKMLP